MKLKRFFAFPLIVLLGSSLAAGSVGVFAAHADSFVPNREIFSVEGGGLAANGGILYDHGSPCTNGLKSCNLANGLTLVNTLAPCVPNSEIACISRVEASTDGSTWVTGEPKGERSSSWPMYAFDGNADAGFGPAHMTNLYQFPGISHDQGSLFEVDPKIQAEVKTGVPINLTTLTSQIMGVYQDGANKWRPLRSAGESGADWVKSDPGCLFQPDNSGICWKAATQNVQTYFRLVLDLPSAPDGWVTGRLVNPHVAFNTINNPSLKSEVVIDGQGLTVPSIDAQYFADNALDKAAWDKLATTIQLPWDDLGRGIQLDPTQIDPYLSYVALDPALNKATSQIDEWTSNLSWKSSRITGTGCTQAGFEGFVGSNSLVYASALPSFDKATQALDYRMASPHFQATGVPLIGAYSLLVAEPIARCIWGIKGELGQASISVVDSDGQSSSVVSSLGQTGGIVHFQAVGFSYSQVQLKAKIASKAVAQASAPPAKAKALTCITVKKPLQTKVISGTNPKCPSGYKAKP